jgi:hypothetical protein
LVSYFDLEEAAGIAVKGVGSIGDTNGTVQNPTGTNWVAGAPGGFTPNSGYDFDGATEFILTDATAAELVIHGALPKTVSAWALTRSFNDGGIFDIGQGVSDGRDFSLRTLGGTNQWRAQFTGGSTDFDFIAPGSVDNWSHFVLTYDGTNAWAYYNGQVIGGRAPGIPLDTLPDQHPFQIGNYSGGNATPGGGEFNGVIDDVAVYNEALMPNQVEHLYNGGDPATLPVPGDPPVLPDARIGRAIYAQQPNGKWNRIELFSTAFETATYDEATTKAEASDYQGIPGHLATPRSLVENFRIGPTLRQGGNQWIGLDDKAVEGDWALADDGQVIWRGVANGAPVGGAFTNWNENEPNDAGSNEDGAEILDSGLWNDHRNNDAGVSRDYVVEYATQLDENPVPLINDGPAGGDGTFGVRTIRVGAMPNGLYESEVNLLAGAGTGQNDIVDSQEPTINFSDPDAPGAGHLTLNPRPYPNDTPGVDDNFFVMMAKGTIRITEEDDYTFAVRGDDGHGLRIVGQTWIEAGNAGGNPIATILDHTSSPGDTLRLPLTLAQSVGAGVPELLATLATGLVHLAAGDYEIELTHFEDNGGADIELLAAQGNKTAIDGDFVLVGDGLPLVGGAVILGDVNGDGDINGLDVDPFVDKLLNGPYQAQADMNEDGDVNGLDVDPFVAAVVGGGAAAVPEPSTLLLCLLALAVVGGWRKWKRAA